MSPSAHFRRFIEEWNAGGMDEALDFIRPFLSDLESLASIEAVASLLYAIIASTAKVYSHAPIDADDAARFVREVFDSLPSSSAGVAPSSSALNDCILDVIWSIDADIEDKENQNTQPSVKDPATEGTQATLNADRAILSNLVKQLLAAGILSRSLCLERLDLALLVGVGLLEDRKPLEKKEIRIRTALFYKQNKFNLLREQTEGYTKLISEVSASLGSPHDPSTGLPVDEDSTVIERAKIAWKKVLGLIGYFDLDPNRALDIVLDMFISHVATHHAFFLALLRHSPWCRSARRNEPSTSMEGLTFEQILQAHEEFSRREGNGSPICAQIIGFKFAHYQKAETKETTPRSMFIAAALMIREGLMNLEDFYPHLAPSDEDMEQVFIQHKENLRKMVFSGQSNALSAAAPLTKDDGIPQRPRQMQQEASKSANTQPSRTPTGPKRPIVQKIALISALLTVGAIRQAVCLISKFPWVVDSHPEISDLLLRILQASLKPSFELHLPHDPEVAAQNSMPRQRWSPSGLVAPLPLKASLTVFAPEPAATMSTFFVFFYPAWSRGVPLCKDDHDMQKILEPLAAMLGLQIHRDLNFFTKLCQLARIQLSQKPPEPELQSMWYRLLRSSILPALSMVKAQSILAVDLWNILKNLETHQRWQLYAEWSPESYRSHPTLELRGKEVNREVKNLLRRLSHENVDRHMMTITKIAHSNPCILFRIIVSQVQAYDNMVPELIKVLGRVTILPLDVLTYVLVDAFSQPDKEHVKDDGISVTDWLTSLSMFSSGLFRAYPRLELSSMLRYILNRLRFGDQKDTIILQDLIAQMCGINTLFDLSESQIVACRGGPILRTEALASNTRGVLSTFASRTADRLLSTLNSTGLQLPLLVLLAQQRQSCIYSARSNHLKALGHLYDTCQAQLVQCIEALNQGSDGQHYALTLPSITALATEYGLEPNICMLLYQPLFRMDFNLAAELRKKFVEENSMSNDSSDQSALLNAEFVQPEGSPWHPMLESLFSDIRAILPNKTHDFLGAPFYATFWQLTAYDLSHPSDRHNEEYNRLRNILKTCNDKVQRRENTEADDLKRTKVQNALNGFVSEAKTQITHCGAVAKRLEIEKQHWFASDQGSSKRIPGLAAQLIKHCFHPRALMSQSDADFASSFIQYLHGMGTPGFHTTAIYDKLLDDGITTTIFSCSEQEALNYGRFLMGMLSNLNKLHHSEEAWKKNNHKGGVHLPGFQRAWTGKEKLEESDLLSWSDFKMLNKKWHKKLAGTLSQCLSSDEYIHIHNAIVILKEVLEEFPISSVNTATGSWIYTTVESCHSTEKRQDLQILIASYKARLVNRRDKWLNPETEAKLSKSNAVNVVKPAESAMDVDMPKSTSVGALNPKNEAVPVSMPQSKSEGILKSAQTPPMPPDSVTTPHNSVAQNGIVKGRDSPRPPKENRITEKRPHEVAPPLANDATSRNEMKAPQNEETDTPLTPGSQLSMQELRMAARQSRLHRQAESERKVDLVEAVREETPSTIQRLQPEEPRKPSTEPPTQAPVSQIQENGGSQVVTPVAIPPPPEPPSEPRAAAAERHLVETSTSVERTQRDPGRDGDRERDRQGDRDKREPDRERRDRTRGDRDRDRDRDHRDRRDRDREKDRHGHGWGKEKDGDRSKDRIREKPSRDDDKTYSRRTATGDSGSSRRNGTGGDEGDSKRRRLSDEDEKGKRDRYKSSGREDKSSRSRGKDGDRDRDRDRDERRSSRRERESKEDVPDDRSRAIFTQTTRSGHDPQSKRTTHPPSGPRAMASGGDNSTRSKETQTTRERSPRRRERDREHVLHQPSPKPSGEDFARDRPTHGKSLGSRLGDGASQGSTPPSPRGGGAANPDDSKKRSYSEHSRGEDAGADAAGQPAKKPRKLHRNRY